MKKFFWQKAINKIIPEDGSIVNNNDHKSL